MTRPYRFWKPEDILFELAIEEPADIDVKVIARFCNVTVLTRELRGCEASIWGNGDQAVILVNSSSHPYRQRFSVGHELGHWMHDRHETLRCDKKALSTWIEPGANRESRANRYAAELLLPRSMVEPRVRKLPITFDSVQSLSEAFGMSRAAVALRLVELGSDAAAVYCSERGRRKWTYRGPEWPESLWLRDWPGAGSLCIELAAEGSGARAGPKEVRADAWLDHANASGVRLVEDSVRTAENQTLTLLWWRDSRQLIELLGGDEGDLY